MSRTGLLLIAIQCAPAVAGTEPAATLSCPVTTTSIHASFAIKPDLEISRLYGYHRASQPRTVWWFVEESEICRSLLPRTTRALTSYSSCQRQM